MPIDVKIPSLGESITGGILAAWLVKDGDFVTRDQIIYELETDKITSEGLAESDGQLHIQIAEGTEVEIGQKIASIDPDQKGAEPAPESPAEAAPATETAAAPAPAAAVEPAGPKNETLSPAVRRLATESGVDAQGLTGSGKAGRVTKGDMLEAIETKGQEPAAPAAKPPVPSSTPTPTPPPAASGDRVTRRKMSPLRKRIAERLVASQQDAAILSTFNEVDLSEIKALRSRYQDAFTKRYGIKLGFMSFFIKAVVHALTEVPGVNAQIDGDTIVSNNFFDIGVAVSTPKGLMVPVIRNCDQLSLAGIEQELAAFSAKARDGKITIQDLEGGCFTVSNGGIFGSLLSTPIINPPQAGILGMHAIQDRPVARDGEVVIRPMMYLALSYDHRLVDGREAVTFLVKVKEALEDPARLVIGV